MKRFFNLFTSIVLAATAIAIISVVLSPTINWLGVNWMFVAAIWIVYARLNQMAAEDWKQRYDSQTNAIKTLKQTLTNTVDGLTELREKYESAIQELEQARLKVSELDQTPSIQKPNTKETKKEYTERDVARIREEMKTVDLESKFKKLETIEEE